MRQRHKHVDVIIAWANGEEIEVEIYPGRWSAVIGPHPSFCPDTNYRIKPKRMKREGWVNVYPDQECLLYESKENADSGDRWVKNGRVACVRIEWEEEE